VPARTLLDLSQPVGILMVAILHFIPDAEDPAGLVARYRDAVVPGSMLAVLHGSAEVDGRPIDRVASAQQDYSQSITAITLRSRQQIEQLLAGFDVVAPGVVSPARWHPDLTTPDFLDMPVYAGVGVKR
jgi:hypothetical protein